MRLGESLKTLWAVSVNSGLFSVTCAVVSHIDFDNRYISSLQPTLYVLAVFSVFKVFIMPYLIKNNFTLCSSLIVNLVMLITFGYAAYHSPDTFTVVWTILLLAFTVVIIMLFLKPLEVASNEIPMSGICDTPQPTSTDLS